MLRIQDEEFAPVSGRLLQQSAWGFNCDGPAPAPVPMTDVPASTDAPVMAPTDAREPTILSRHFRSYGVYCPDNLVTLLSGYEYCRCRRGRGPSLASFGVSVIT